MPRSVLLAVTRFILLNRNTLFLVFLISKLVFLKAYADIAPTLSKTTFQTNQVSSAIILQYHHVSDQTPPSTSTTPEQFIEHLTLIEQEGFSVKSLPWIIQQLELKKTIPDKTLAITFDDGYLSIYQTAYPLLKQRNWPFTIFISPAPIDQQWGNTLNWSQLKEMQSAGATIANHSYHHHHLLERLTDDHGKEETQVAWQARIRNDILATEHRLQEKLGQETKLIAYPYGEYNFALQQLVKELGFVGFGQQSGPVGFDSDMTALPRFPAAGIYANPKTLKVKLYTLPFHILKQTHQTELNSGQAPTLNLTVKQNGFRTAQVQCFYQGQTIDTQTSTVREDNEIRVHIQAKADTLGKGRRHRYNCTAPAMNGQKYFWFSHSWLRSSEQEG